jgi:siroheme synthase-like protein
MKHSTSLAAAVPYPEAAPGNPLFPVFLKLETLRLLIIGGGAVGLEKLNAVLNNAPATRITLVALTISNAVRELATAHPHICLLEKAYDPGDLDHADLILVAVNDPETSFEISQDAKAAGILANVADQPDLCDFYLGSIVQKANLKIAISTNGQSPTLAKRLKEVLQETIPDEFESLLHNMHQLRGRMKGDFSEKVRQLNKLTGSLVGQDNELHPGSGKWKKVAYWCFFAFVFLFIGNLIASYITIREIGSGIVYYGTRLDRQFYWMLLAGFLAQMVDGALGMGYGVTCTSVLLSIGVPLPAISSSIHTAEMFSSGASGFSHYKFGNVNKKLFRLILIPGVLGAVTGAWLLARFGQEYASYIRPLLAGYTLLLGIRILRNAFKKNKGVKKKLKHVGWLAGAGGFLDSFGGGGWGPLVTSTLIAKGKSPRYVIGTVSLTEFFVTLASALTFFSFIGISHWQVILGLVIGGMAAAPFAAKLAGKLPLKTMFIGVGSLIIIWSLNILLRTML